MSIINIECGVNKFQIADIKQIPLVTSDIITTNPEVYKIMTLATSFTTSIDKFDQTNTRLTDAKIHRCKDIFQGALKTLLITAFVVGAIFGWRAAFIAGAGNLSSLIPIGASLTVVVYMIISIHFGMSLFEEHSQDCETERSQLYMVPVVVGLFIGFLVPLTNSLTRVSSLENKIKNRHEEINSKFSELREYSEGSDKLKNLKAAFTSVLKLKEGKYKDGLPIIPTDQNEVLQNAIDIRKKVFVLLDFINKLKPVENASA